MKKSQKSLLTVIGSIGAIIILVIAYTRVASPTIQPGGPKIDIQENLTGFTSIDASGSWKIGLIKGDSWSVETNSLEGIKDHVSIYVENDTLVLKQKSGSLFNWSSSEVVAKVTMPELTKIKSAGSLNTIISGFTGDELTIQAAGSTKISSNESQYQTLIIKTAGSSTLDFKEMLAIDANVALAGSSKLIITMNGGELTGSIAGSGNVEYYGDVSNQSIKIAGSGNIEKMD